MRKLKLSQSLQKDHSLESDVQTCGWMLVGIWMRWR